MFSVRMTEHNPKEGELTMDTKGFTFATTEDVKKLSLTRAEKDRYSPNYVRHYKINHVVNAFEHPFDDNLTEKLGFSDSFKVEPCVVAPNEHHHYYEYNYNAVNQREWKLKKGMVDNFKKLPMFLLVQLSSWQTKVKTPKMTEKLEALAATARNPVFMGEAGGERWNSYYHNDHLGSANVIVEVEYNGSYIPMAVSFAVAEKVFGLEVTDDMKLRISSGAECEFTGWKEMFENLNGYRRSWRDKVEKFDFTYASLHSVESKIGCGKKNLGRLLKALLKSKAWILEQPGKLSGIKKTWLRLEPVMNEVLEENPMALVAYRSFAYECARAIDGVKVSAVFNDIFDKVNTKEEFVKALKDFYAGKDRDEDGDLMDANSKLEASVKRLDVYKARRKEILKSQANRAFAKIQEEAENLTIDKKKHKLTWAKIEAGELALGVFFRKSEQYFLLNDNWDLWEEMFKRGYGDQAIELANEVKGRSTYEKDLMSYFYFVLHGLPEYLKKQTGEKWTCIPKLVNSADELEPPKEDSGGVARKRSALTPQVDNEAKTVVVPYASLAISGGFGTTYCYSHDYHVLTKGYSLGGYAVTKDVEEKLNGQFFTFSVITHNDKKLWVTVEAGCLEVNQEPGTRNDLHDKWYDLDKRAKSLGFYPSLKPGEAGNFYQMDGAAHFNFGWKNPQNNLWLRRPDLLANFLELPLIVPSIMYLLSHHNDLSQSGNSSNPYNTHLEHVVKFNQFISRLRSFISTENISNEEIFKLIDKIIPGLYRMHSVYINLKKFKLPNPYLELRFQLSFDDVATMEAVADFWIEVIYLLLNKGLTPIFANGVFSGKTYDNMHPFDLIDQIKRFFVILDLEPSLRLKLLNIQNLRQKKDPYTEYLVDQQSSIELVGKQRSYTSVDDKNVYSFEIKSPNSKYELLILDPSSDKIVSTVNHKFRVNLSVLPIEKRKIFLASIYDSKNKNIIGSFAITLQQNEFGAQIQLGIPLESINSDAKFFEDFFFLPFRRLGGIDLNPYGNCYNSTFLCDDTTQSKVEFYYRAFPFLESIFFHQFFNNRKFDFVFKKNAGLKVIKKILVNGYEIPFESAHSINTIFYRLEELTKHIVKIPLYWEHYYFIMQAFDEEGKLISADWLLWSHSKQKIDVIDFTKIDYSKTQGFLEPFLHLFNITSRRLDATQREQFLFKLKEIAPELESLLLGTD
jgi:hypothetical protein